MAKQHVTWPRNARRVPDDVVTAGPPDSEREPGKTSDTLERQPIPSQQPGHSSVTVEQVPSGPDQHRG